MQKGKLYRAKLTDVARLAGISTSTVSYILKDPENNRFSEETNQKVLDAVEKLNYIPATFAQQMKGKTLPVIGLIIPSIENHFYPEVTSGFTAQANKLGYNVILLNSNNSIEQEQSFIDTLISMNVSGVAMCGVSSVEDREKDIVKRLNSLAIPIVRFDRYVAEDDCPSVGIDNYQAGYYMTERIIQGGHKKIACILPKNSVFIVEERKRGYKDAMRKNNLQELVYTFESTDFGSIYGCLQMLMGNEKPTAVFTPGGDMDAIEVIKSAGRLNINVPNDLSIAGFDDIYVSEMINPSLTTIRQPKFKIGEAAMKLLQNLIDGKNLKEGKVLLPFEFIARESVKLNFN